MNKFGPGGAQLSDKTLLIGGAVVVVLALAALWYVKRQVDKAADAVGEAVTDTADYLRNDAVNITSEKNLVNTIATGTAQAFGILGTNDYTGQPNTIGSALEEAKRKGKDLFGAFL